MIGAQETQNFACHADSLRLHRAKLETWIEETGDLGSESPEVYSLETDDQIKSIKIRDSLEAYQKEC